MKQATLELIAPLLAALRANPALHEVQPTFFQLNGRDFLHFHEESDRVVADVRLTNSFVRMPVSSASGQAELLDRVDNCLSSLDARVRDRARRGPRGQRQARGRFNLSR
jgi:hypothetical protein